ncbi:4-hydroxy-tetrahydrodipicolinate synthase [Sulfoacidibacillus thermotolerans]|uniref:4-hydroxy-tetrahydrodipicolinate synthase n=1 Tax=Sulfoacidibacillus thermotolerans TaxID=1765684 RepID=A0A2U3DAC3_SULT2|nr:4-hydroxy-tetrahydrodipicolinate synthase [Sulfoacidibacillus thermotolerans]PWI58231.1 4-hydroxy-tetrahydrodipicolinate synthase [Sulfoacidibacillus thermotolerans]
MFGQLVTAMVTPFDDSLELALDRLPKLIDHLIATGTTGLVVSGTTGESATLTHREKLTLFEETVRHVNGRIPVIAGTGGNNTAEAIAFTKEVDQLHVDAFLLVAPYYNKPSQEGLYQHFKSVAQVTDKPIIVYNIPGRTSVNITPETIIRLAEIDNIVAVKESSGDFTQISRIIGETPEDFYVYSGDDKFTLPILALGGHGVVSVASHVVGDPMSAMLHAFFDGDLNEARRLHHRLMPLFEGLFKTSNPVLVKAALEMLNVRVGSVRLPLVAATPEELRELRRTLGTLLDLTIVH